MQQFNHMDTQEKDAINVTSRKICFLVSNIPCTCARQNTKRSKSSFSLNRAQRKTKKITYRLVLAKGWGS